MNGLAPTPNEHLFRTTSIAVGYARSGAGFTLVEALVALALLTVGLIPSFLQASGALALSQSIRNTVVAAHLAQEGIEVARALRDESWFSGQPFDQGLNSCAAGCQVQYDTTTPLNLLDNPPLKIDPDTGLFQYAIGDDSPFSRRITVTPVSPEELKVIGVITWRERSVDRSFSVETHLFNWAP